MLVRVHDFKETYNPDGTIFCNPTHVLYKKAKGMVYFTKIYKVRALARFDAIHPTISGYVETLNWALTENIYDRIH